MKKWWKFITIKYCGEIKPLMVWGPFVAYIEHVGYMAVPMHKCRSVERNIFECRVRTNAPFNIIEDAKKHILKNRKNVFPWIIDIHKD